MKRSKKIKTGFFTVNDLHIICNSQTLAQAKVRTKRIIDTFIKKHPKTRPENIKKVMTLLEKCNTVDKLGISVANFMLAHPSENLSMS